MSLIKKSDVKNHLSTRTRASVYPFGLARPDYAANAQSNSSSEKANAPDISISPSRPISPEPVPNAQVGGSVGVTNGEGKS
jgi:hypothetical protein